MTSITRFLLKHAGWVASGGFLLTAVGGYYATHLFGNLRTEIEELLPTHAQSVLDLNEVRSRLESTNSMSLMFVSKNTEATNHLVDDLALAAKKISPDVIAGVEYRINKEVEFFNSRKSLFIQQNDLQSIRNYVKNRIDYEIQLYNPLTIIENREIAEPKLDFEALKRKYIGKADAYSHFKDGYYASPDQTMRVMLFALPGKADGIEGCKRLRNALDQLVAEVNPLKYSPE